MINRLEHQGITWIDLENPSGDEITSISKEFSIGPVLAKELLSPTTKPRVDVYAENAYAVFHFPSLEKAEGEANAKELDIIFGKKYLITVHYEPLEAIHEMRSAFEAEMLMAKNKGLVHVGHLIFELVERMYRGSEYQLQAIEEKIQSIEDRIFKGQERQMVFTISKVSRELLKHKRILSNHKETLETLEQVGASILGTRTPLYIRGMQSLQYRVYTHATILADTINEVRETNMAMLSTRQNEAMKNLTIMAFVMLPLTLITGIFGMNAIDMPIIGTPNDFWIILGGMFALATLFFAYFKIKRWF